MSYSPERVMAEVDKDRDRLFAPYAFGRPEGWIPDQRTKDLVCIGNWLHEELTRIGANDADRKTQLWYYNRWSRSEEDLWTLAARTLNDVLEGKVEQNRKPHRRWG